MPGPLFIETDRLELRTPEADDKPFPREDVNHPAVRRYVDAWRTPTTAGEYDDLSGQYDADEDAASRLVVPKAGDRAGEPVGSGRVDPAPPVDDPRGWMNLGAWIHLEAWGTATRRRRARTSSSTASPTSGSTG